MIRKFALITLALVVVVCSISVGVTVPTFVSGEENLFTVVIDAGHGGIDGGVVGKNTGVKEADINLSVAKKLKNCFEAEGFKVVMTRSTDGGLYGLQTKGFKARDLKKRVEIAKEACADVFISVHMNNYQDGARRGGQVFFKTDSPESKAYANAIQTELNALPDAVRQFDALPGDYYVLNNAPTCAVLVECGFLSNAEDEKLLVDEGYQEIIAHAIYYGTVNAIFESGKEVFEKNSQ